MTELWVARKTRKENEDGAPCGRRCRRLLRSRARGQQDNQRKRRLRERQCREASNEGVEKGADSAERHPRHNSGMFDG